MTISLLEGDARTILPVLADSSVRCCVTSPPYFGLRDYGHAGQMGREASPREYVDGLVAVMREVRRVLAWDGTLWLNLGDAFATSGSRKGNSQVAVRGSKGIVPGYRSIPTGFKNKDLMMLPARVAIALQEDGWYLRRDIVWHKPNGMPESVRDRPTSSHEFVFLLAKGEQYYYDEAAIRTPLKASTHSRLDQNRERQAGSARANGDTRRARPMKAVARSDKQSAIGQRHAGFNQRYDASGVTGATARSVWTIPTEGSALAHFAMMPTELARRCIAAGSAPGDWVLDPFGGAGTTALVADRLGRSCTTIELNPKNIALTRRRLASDVPLFPTEIVDASGASIPSLFAEGSE